MEPSLSSVLKVIVAYAVILLGLSLVGVKWSLRLRILAALTIGIIFIFAFIFLGMALYQPVWFYFQKRGFESPDPDVRKASAKNIAAKGRDAIPCVSDQPEVCPVCSLSSPAFSGMLS